MKNPIQNPKMRFPIAMGASIGIGHALFRGLTENFGPIIGMAVFLPSLMIIVLSIFFVLGLAAKRLDNTQANDVT